MISKNKSLVTKQNNLLKNSSAVKTLAVEHTASESRDHSQPCSPVGSSQRWELRTRIPSRTSGSGEPGWQRGPTGLWPAQPKWTRDDSVKTLRWFRASRKLKTSEIRDNPHVWNHGGFALSPSERVHLLVFGILSFSLRGGKKQLINPLTHSQFISCI